MAGGTWICVPALAIALPVLQDRDLHRKAVRMQRGFLHNFPVFLGLMAAILYSGISLSNALELCASSLPDPDGPFGLEIAGIRAATRAGQPAAAGFDRLAARMAVPEIQASLSLLAQYERTGGRELVSLIRMQVPACWAVYRNAIRKQMEEHAVCLLIPMTLDLVAVIALAGLPAMMTFQG
jgi:Flp pilus assembly protein TadB